MIVTIIQGLWKEGSKRKKIIMKVLVAKGLWKEGNKKKNLLWKYLWSKRKYIPPPTVLMASILKKPKPSIIVIMIARKKYLL